MEHLSNSKELFRTLVRQVVLPESKEEIESVVMVLLEKRCGLSRTEILAGEMTDCRPADLAEDIRRINAHEPVQYVLGSADFFGREFLVNRDVLIPRPETELLVEEAIRLARALDAPDAKVLDIGTGSGCIAISLALSLPWKVSAVDISDGALDIAAKNARALGAHVELHRHDMLGKEAFPGTWDLIVSNPPYVRRAESQLMRANVTDFEPHIALFVPDDDPLVFHRTIAAYGKTALKPGGSVLVEINEVLGPQTQEVFAAMGYKTQLIRDLSNKQRLLAATTGAE